MEISQKDYKGRTYPAETDVFNTSGEDVFLFNKNDSRTHCMSANEYRLFGTLLGIRTEEEHLERAASASLGRYSLSVLRERIRAWSDCGLLRDESLLAAGVSAASRATYRVENSPRISQIIITRNRSRALKRCLESRIESPHFAERRIPFLIYDDSDADAAAENRALCAEAEKRYSAPIRYAGAAERADFSRRLLEKAKAAGLPVDAIRFGIQGAASDAGAAYGAVRNSALLMARTAFSDGEAGGALHTLFSDDDLYYRLYAPQEAVWEGGVFLLAHDQEFQFVEDGAALETFAQAVERDLPARMLELLDTPPAALIGDVHDAVYDAIHAGYDAAGLPPAMARSMEEGGAAVAAISAGYAGARWYGSPYTPALVRAQNGDAAFYHDEATYRRVMRNGLNLTSSPRVIIHNGANLLSGVLALNARVPLPPFFPVGRGEDALFAAIMRLATPDCFQATLPAALYHDPAEKPPLTGADFAGAPPESCDLARAVLLFDVSRYPLAARGAAAFDELARRFRERAALPPADFTEYLAALVRDSLRARADQCERLLDLFGGEPAWWASDIRAYMSSLIAIADQPRVPPDFQAALGLYGDLLSCWNAL
jgi:hypothetical protein